jgi:nucleoside-diphosphate-sugar epimerase
VIRVFAADSWPQVFDDSAAREDWSWQHKYDIDTMVTAMIEDIRRQYNSL